MAARPGRTITVATTGKTSHETAFEGLPATFLDAVRQDLNDVGFCAVAAVTIIWSVLVSPQWKLVALASAAGFAPVELMYTGLLSQTDQGWNIKSLKDIKRGRTTAEQFIANILFTPLIFYFRFLIGSPVAIIICTPVAIWMLEIIEGTALRCIFGYNRAWHYTGPWAVLNGTLDLHMFPYWLLFGFLNEYFMMPPVMKHLGAVNIFGEWLPNP